MKGKDSCSVHWRKFLRCAVLAGIAAGVMLPFSIWAETYNSGIKGSDDMSDRNVYGKVMKTDGTGNMVFDFSSEENTYINNKLGPGITSSGGGNKKISIKGKNIHIKSRGEAGGISFFDGGDVHVTGNLDIDAYANSNYMVKGLGFGYWNDDGHAYNRIVVDGDVRMRKDDSANPWAIDREIESGWITPSPRYEGAMWRAAGISAGASNRSEITINGMVDLAIKGNAVSVHAYWPTEGVTDERELATINLRGGRIITPQTQDASYWALFSGGGTINLNMNKEKNGAANYDVELVGNVMVMKNADHRGDAYFYKNGRLNIGLSTTKSRWVGIIDNAGKELTGEVNLYLSNKATWDYTAASKPNGIELPTLPSPSNAHYNEYDGVSYVTRLVGGSTDEQAGAVLMKDKAPLEIANYSGHTYFYYGHTADGTSTDNYTAGAVRIHNASPDSYVRFLTDRTGVTADNTNQVLNALAGKLYYMAAISGKKDLQGEVGIADGLTASSKSLQLADMKFDQSTGKASAGEKKVNPPNPPQEKRPNQIVEGVGSINSRAETWKALGIRDENRNYTFKEDTVIGVEWGVGVEFDEFASRAYAPIMWSSDDDGSIDMTGHSLTLQATKGNQKYSPHGIYVGGGKLTIKNTNGINIQTEGGNTPRGIMVLGSGTMPESSGYFGKGQAYLVIANSDKKEDSVNIKIKDAIENYPAIYAKKNVGSARIDIHGLVNVEMPNKGPLARAVSSSGGQIYLGGGQIIAPSAEAITVDAVREKDPTSFIHVNAQVNAEGKIEATSGRRDVVIHGNVTSNPSSAKKAESARVAIALTTAESELRGLMTRGKWETIYGQNMLMLTNGAKWINESNVVDAPASRLVQLAGASSMSIAGVIQQRDKGEITVDQYRGHTYLAYEHTDDGTEGSHYTAGDTHIVSAEAGSSITVMTGNDNIDVNKKEQVYKVLNALAGKLYYDGYAKNERNLTGTVMIADGLTASSKSLQLADMKFKDNNGQGYVDEQSSKPKVKTTFTKTINLRKQDNKEYIDAGVWDGNGSVYHFEQDSIIKIGEISEGYGVNVGSKKFELAASDKTITLDINAKNKGAGINIGSANFDWNAAQTIMRIKAEGSEAKGIYLSGDDESKSIIHGMTDMDIKAGDNAYGIHGVDGNLSLEGWKFVGAGKKVFAIHAEGSSNIYVNYDDKEANTHKATNHLAQVTGDIMTTHVESSGDGSSSYGTAALGLGTKDSYWRGLSVYQDRTEKEDEESDESSSYSMGRMLLALQNGGTWYNEAAHNQAVEEGFKGSRISRLTGGATPEAAGNIFQNDSRTLTIDRYQGHTKLFYAHENKGTTAADYKGGDTHIKTAVDGAHITLVTDNRNIDMSNSNEVNSVLNTLAGKLYYDAYVKKGSVDGERKLIGSVMIADGLTASSKSINLSDMKFKDKDGQGYIELLTPSAPSKPNTITGDETEDTYYVQKGICQADGTYRFLQDTTISQTDGNPAINVKKKVVIDAKGHTLTLDVKAGNPQLLDGVSHVSSPNELKMTVGKLNIRVTNTKSRAEGISMRNNNAKLSTTEINGDVDVQVSGKGYTLGMYAVGNSHLTINGNVIMRKNDPSSPWGVDGGASTGEWAYYSISGIYSGSNYGNPPKGGQITVNGDVDLAIRGTGILANGAGSQVIVKGGGKIEIERNDSGIHYAVDAQSGTAMVNVNEDGSAAGTKDLQIKGNIGVTNGSVNPAEPVKNSIVTIGLATKSSRLDGVVVNNHTKKNNQSGFYGISTIYLQNGAVWNNEAYGMTDKGFTGSYVTKLVGGSAMTPDKAGFIQQKDTKQLTIDEYSGHTYLAYEHTNDGSEASYYTAGDTHIKTATSGSSVTMMTNNTGIDMGNSDKVNKVLNALAGKLYYDAYATPNGQRAQGERNLIAKVMIADGLTASSKSMNLSDMKFKDKDGQGYVESSTPPTPSPKPTTSEFTKTINLRKQDNKEYIDAGVWDGNGSVYRFAKDSIVSIKTSSESYGVNSGQNELNVDAGDKTITLDIGGVTKAIGTIIGQNKFDWKAAHTVMKINAQNGDANGIEFSGTDTDEITARFYGMTEMNVSAGDNVAGIHAYDGALSLEGWKFVGAGKKVFAIHAEGSSNIYVNYDDKEANTHKATNHLVQVTGDIMTTHVEYSGDPSSSYGTVALGLGTKDSYWRGLSVYQDRTEKEDEESDDSSSTIYSMGRMLLALQNGGTWYNEAAHNQAVEEGFKGSRISRLTGGATPEAAGNIFQNDSRTLTIDRYQGHTKLFYAHENKGTTAADYKGGDTHIKTAVDGAHITLVTDSNNINLKDDVEVRNVLTALAGKLYYDAAKTNGQSTTGENKLTSKVGIAEGLTSSSKSLFIADLTFKNMNGQGELKADAKITPLPKPPIKDGEYETPAMQGVRSSMMNASLNWQMLAREFGGRMAEIHHGAEDGAWARVNHVKSTYRGNMVMDAQDTTIQVGFDKVLSDSWNVGIGLAYQEGQADYQYDGKGDYKNYAVGIYATHNLKDGAYFDLSAKIGQVKNDFIVKMKMKDDLAGSYITKGIAATVQYGKRMIQTGGSYIEPQIQLTWSGLSGKKYDAKSGTEILTIDQKPYTSLVGRIGVEAGMGNERSRLFARASIAHEFLGDIEGDYMAKDGGLKTTKFEMKDSWLELGVGGRYSLAENTALSFSLSRDMTGNYRREWNVGVRLDYRF